MKILPDQSPNHTVKTCICGHEKKAFEVYKQKYQNMVLLTIFGIFGFLTAVVLTPVAILQETQLSNATWIGVVVGWFAVIIIVIKIIRLISAGHNLFCSIRRVIIDFAR